MKSIIICDSGANFLDTDSGFVSCRSWFNSALAGPRRDLRARLQNLDFDVGASLRRNLRALVLFVELEQTFLVEFFEDVFPVHAGRAVLDGIAKFDVADPA